MYRGCELNHWRPPYKGQWQVQVFFHFVDANGPYKDHAMDGRQSLGTQKGQENPVENQDNTMTHEKAMDIYEAQ